jgi:membrane-associated phospholipid phosphatase
MKQFKLCSAALALSLFAAWLIPAARAQVPDDEEAQPPRCTDLSGKVELPCPSGHGQPPDVGADPDAAVANSGVLPAKHTDARSAARGNTAAPSAAVPVPTAVKTAPAAEQPRSAAVRATAAPQPVLAAPDPRAAIGLHPKTPPDPEPIAPLAAPSLSRASRPPEATLVRNLVRDQKSIWTSPLHLRLDDVQWLAPLLAAGTVTVLSDTDIESHLPTSSTLQTRSKSYSTYGVAAFAGASGAAWLLGTATHDDHMRQTGLLSAEAALDSFALTYAIKSIAQRDRPFQGNGHGTFFSHGDSFPSEHAAAAWSMATVIAHQYPGPLTTLFAYGGAAAVSAMRVTGRQHFASDALVGSALGFFVGRHVYNAHHDREDLARYGTFERSRAAESPRSPENMGSVFVPLDSWVYDAFDRLAALGYVHTAFAGLKPWTRLECVRLLDEASSRVLSEEGAGGSEQALHLYRSLQAEFALDSETVADGRNVAAHLESIYTRFTGISGRPINDGYHFGQTIINDFGRPYAEGANLVTGFSARAEAGPLAFYVRGEYQHAPSGPVLPEAARQTIAAIDLTPFVPPGSPSPSVPPGIPSLTIDRFRLLDAYVAINIENWQLSLGKQSLWWGPGLGGPMMFSDNAEPINMLRFNRVAPLKLPSILGWLGPMRTEAFLGRLAGYEFILTPSGRVGQWGRALDTQPFVSGQKISFQPTENLEFGFSRSTVYGGPSYPFTLHTFLRSLFSGSNTTPGQPDKPGDRRSGLNFSYRLPKLRNWLTFYADGFTEDEYSPIAYWDRSVWRAGLYVPQIPKINKLDLRVEGGYTDNPIGGLYDHGYSYWNATWRSGYTNQGNLLGSWMGRQGQGGQAWASYHFSPRNMLQFSFRHQKVSQHFLPGGGTLADFGIRDEFWHHSGVSVSALVQYERWTFPVLAPGAESNLTSSVQLTFSPRHWSKP